MSQRLSFNKHQQGAALVVGLIMLLLLTLVGVAGMRDTLLQEKMTGNMRDREVALQAAESALRDAEAVLNSITLPEFTNSGGIYNLDEPAGLTLMQRISAGKPVSEKEFWLNWQWENNARDYSHNLIGVAEQPQFVIERLPRALTDRGQYPGTSDPTYVMAEDLTEVIETVESIPDYRITARGTGMTTNSIVILQSTFRRQAEAESP